MRRAWREKPWWRFDEGAPSAKRDGGSRSGGPEAAMSRPCLSLEDRQDGAGIDYGRQSLVRRSRDGAHDPGEHGRR